MRNVFMLSYRRPDTARGFTPDRDHGGGGHHGYPGCIGRAKLMGRTDDARIIAAKQDIATVMQALKLYKLDNQRYPTTEQGLQALIAKPATGPAANGWKTGGYLDKLPKDPWGNPINICLPASRARSM